MSTQHPDNVSVPIFAASALMGPEDEIREAYYAFAHLGCDEQMWDHEGKEVDVFVVEKLLTSYEPFFRDEPLGERIRLTPRVPNPRVERLQAKGLLELLHSLPRHADAARAFYGEERPPVTEVILPMTTSADEMERISRYYRRYVVGLADERLLPDDLPLREWVGELEPKSIAVIPLLEDLPFLLGAEKIVEAYALGKDLAEQRVFIARSDPALNYGMTAAVIVSLVALDRLHRAERRLGLPIYPIIGCGSVPFRGSLSPARVDAVLARYPSVQTFTLQSAFKYDHPADEVMRAVKRLRSAERSAPLEVADDDRLLDILDRSARRYRDEVAEVAALVNAVSPHVPRRRMRKLHIGLYGYSRGGSGVSLPRAITFCAAMYAVGLPPEALGLAALTRDDLDHLELRIPGFADDLREAAAYLDPEVISELPPLAAQSARALLDHAPPDSRADHVAISRAVRKHLGAGTAHAIPELLVRGAMMRRFLG
jgi:phosphoenolpyruvate carboxylase